MPSSAYLIKRLLLWKFSIFSYNSTCTWVPIIWYTIYWVISKFSTARRNFTFNLFQPNSLHRSSWTHQLKTMTKYTKQHAKAAVWKFSNVEESYLVFHGLISRLILKYFCFLQIPYSGLERPFNNKATHRDTQRHEASHVDQPISTHVGHFTLLTTKEVTDNIFINHIIYVSMIPCIYLLDYSQGYKRVYTFPTARGNHHM